MTTVGFVGLGTMGSSGVDPALAAEVMGTSSIGSPMLKARIPLIVHLPEHACFDVELMHKDIRLVCQAATDLQISLPAAATADRLLTTARQLGYGHRDLAALHDVLATPAALQAAAFTG